MAGLEMQCSQLHELLDAKKIRAVDSISFIPDTPPGAAGQSGTGACFQAGPHVAIPVPSVPAIFTSASHAMAFRPDASVAHAGALAAVNTRCYYAWGVRRQALAAGALTHQQELHFTRVLLAGKGVKAAELWAHHAAVLHGVVAALTPPAHAACLLPLQPGTITGTSPPLPCASAAATVDTAGVVGVLQQELRLCQRAATTHKRLAYAWRHRLAVTQALLGLQDTPAALEAVVEDLGRVQDWVRLRPGDHSAWHHRSTVLGHVVAGVGDCPTLVAALWSRELLLHKYVGGVHPGHFGQAHALKSLVAAAGEGGKRDEEDWRAAVETGVSGVGGGVAGEVLRGWLAATASEDWAMEGAKSGGGANEEQ